MGAPPQWQFASIKIVAKKLCMLPHIPVQVLRGAGEGQTVLYFPDSMTTIYGNE